jgi:hypothetical protein
MTMLYTLSDAERERAQVQVQAIMDKLMQVDGTAVQ